jgi:hypothetical protein
MIGNGVHAGLIERLRSQIEFATSSLRIGRACPRCFSKSRQG